MNIVLILVIASLSLSIVSGFIASRSAYGSGWEIIGTVLAFLFGGVCVFSTVVSFASPFNIGDVIELECETMRTNNTTCVTFVGLNKDLSNIVSESALAWNGTNLTVHAQKKKNCWGISMPTSYKVFVNDTPDNRY